MQIDDVQVIEPNYIKENSEIKLSILEVSHQILFLTKRIFIVYGSSGETRGNHSHKQCGQILFSLEGEISVECDDGGNKKIFFLEKGGQGIFIPSGIWANQYYKSDAILLVICDMVYSEDDYIRNYEQFISYRNSQ
jgi:mannose-6-phosphate isomerase-like protein (cupin superfamily)